MVLDRMRVLLAEDNLPDARLLRETLIDAVGAGNFEMVHVESLAAAIACLQDAAFDLVLLDLSLPDECGLATVERVRAAAPDVPIVILTGLDDDTTALQALRAGAQDYLVKNQISSHVLLRALRLAIERKAMEAERQRIERIKDEFVAVVSHELRTPLAAIRGALALLEQARAKNQADEGSRLLAMARRNTDRLTRLVNEILDLERLESGASLPAIRPVCA
jgi:DNA-binding response OmpR family regulator